MAKGPVYEAVGKLVGRADALGEAASKLRRRWRLLRDAAGESAPNVLAADIASQLSSVPRPRPQREEPLMKRAKLGLL